jgi:hypothetical protein
MNLVWENVSEYDFTRAMRCLREMRVFGSPHGHGDWAQFLKEFAVEEQPPGRVSCDAFTVEKNGARFLVYATSSKRTIVHGEGNVYGNFPKSETLREGLDALFGEKSNLSDGETPFDEIEFDMFGCPFEKRTFVMAAHYGPPHETDYKIIARAQ